MNSKNYCFKIINNKTIYLNIRKMRADYKKIIEIKSFYYPELGRLKQPIIKGPTSGLPDDLHPGTHATYLLRQSVVYSKVKSRNEMRSYSDL